MSKLKRRHIVTDSILHMIAAELTIIIRNIRFRNNSLFSIFSTGHKK